MNLAKNLLSTFRLLANGTWDSAFRRNFLLGIGFVWYGCSPACPQYLDHPSSAAMAFPNRPSDALGSVFPSPEAFRSCLLDEPIRPAGLCMGCTDVYIGVIYHAYRPLVRKAVARLGPLNLSKQRR